MVALDTDKVDHCWKKIASTDVIVTAVATSLSVDELERRTLTRSENVSFLIGHVASKFADCSTF